MRKIYFLCGVGLPRPGPSSQVRFTSSSGVPAILASEKLIISQFSVTPHYATPTTFYGNSSSGPDCDVSPNLDLTSSPGPDCDVSPNLDLTVTCLECSPEPDCDVSRVVHLDLTVTCVRSSPGPDCDKSPDLDLTVTCLQSSPG
ncbi:hypothetical protein WMY93_031372 [Mugilogobius chulae]|uniref:Uncharacterized protein n=1 Tax=Mugilogobius chulae TaxID=88201 RepID=A0AAW0MEA1_9GOBI